MKKPEKEVTASAEAAPMEAAVEIPANEPAETAADEAAAEESAPEAANEPDEKAAEVTAAAAAVPIDEVERLVAEAEQRGYLRGRNETIEAEVMPAPAPSAADDSTVGESCPSFLAHLRPGFWD